MKERMICDLHTHILHGIDDGSHSLEYSLEMLHNAYSGYVDTVVLTPHCIIREASSAEETKARLYCFERDLADRFCELKREAEACNCPVRILSGAELHVTSSLQSLLRADRENRNLSVNKSRYLLTEFDMDCEADSFLSALEIIIQEGYVPLVAHPERYGAVIRDPGIVEDWLELGCHIQVTGGSITGKFGREVRKTAIDLLNEDLVCCVASDAHNTTTRDNNLLGAYDYLETYYGRGYADTLLYKNPTVICEDGSF